MSSKQLQDLFNNLISDGELSETVDGVANVYLNMAGVIKDKNGKYGNAATSPINIFCHHLKPDSDKGTNSILVRLDDKLSRVKNSDVLRFNDIADIMGYLALLCQSKDWTTKEMFDSLKD